MTQIETKSKPQIPEPVPDNELEAKALAFGMKALVWFKNVAPRIFMEGASVLLTLAILWLGALGVLMNRQSVDLKFFKPHYENWFSNAFAGKHANIEAYSAHWVQERQAIEIRAQNIKITGQTGSRQDIGEVRGEFAIAPKILSRPVLTKLYIDGGALTIARDVRGRLQMGLGTPETFKMVGPLWLSKNQVDSSSSAQLDAINFVSVKDADIYIKDDQYGANLFFQGVDGIYKNDGENISIQSQGVFTKQGRNAPYHLKLQTTSKWSSTSLILGVKEVFPIDLASQRGPFTALSNLDAPVDLDLELKISPTTGLSDLLVKMNIGEGKWKTKQTYKPFESARLEAQFDAENQAIIVSDYTIKSQPLSGKFTGSVKNIGTVKTGFLKTPIEVDIATDGFVLNPGSSYYGPLTLKQSWANGLLDLATKTLKLDTLNLDFGDFQAELNLFAKRRENGGLSALNVDGEMLGVINPVQILSLWPNDVALGGRNWIVKSLQAAEFSNMQLHMALTEEDLTSQIFDNDHFNLSFDVKNVDIRYLRQMPWLRNNSGRGVLRGNQFEYTMFGGNVDGLALEKGFLFIPVISPSGAEFSIDLYGSGTAREMLRVSDFKPLEIASRFGITPSDFGGEGRIHLQIKRPLKDYVDPELVKYDLSGDFTNVSMPVGFGGNNLNGGNISLHVNRQGMEISGPIKVGKWQAVLDWRKLFNAVPIPADFTLVGTLTRDDLDNLGIGLRKHYGGIVDIILSGKGNGFEVQTIDLAADFTKADVNIGSLWSKPNGAPAKLEGVLTTNGQGSGGLENFTAEAEGLLLTGSMSLAKNLQLQNLDMSRAYIKGLVDAQIKAKPTPEGVLVVDVTGEYVNLASWVDRAFKTQSGLVSAPMFLNGKVKKLALAENYLLDNATAEYSHNGVHVSHAKLEGETEFGTFIAEILQPETQPKTEASRNFKVNIPNAAHAALSVLGLSNIKDGTLEIKGQLPLAGEAGGVNGSISLADFTLVRAPAFTQLLSLASLQGMANTLSGEGLKFEKLDVDFSLESGVFKIRDGRASGPALGLTAAGDVNLTDKAIDFNGVLVPAYTVNSILGDIPLLGSVMVGKKGEGIFALNYTMKGPIKQIQVSVNPLSALTPGFLRRIFDVSREKISDTEVLDIIEKQKQKQKQ